MKYALLFSILMLAGLLRMYQFGALPFGLNRDEAALGYNAYSILKTGRDEFGRWLPTRFESFGDWKQPVYVYAIIPFIAFLGLTEQAVRMPALLAGMMSVWLVFELGYRLGSDRSRLLLAGVGGLMLAVNPWHIHFSKTGYEATLALFFVLLGIWWYLAEQPGYWGRVGLCFGLALMTYHAALVFVPLFFGLLLIGRWKRVRLADGMGIGLMLVLIGLLFWRTFFSGEQVKAAGLLITDDSAETRYAQIYSKRDGSLWSLIRYNGYVYYGWRLVQHWVSSYGLDFLVLRGGSHPVHNVPGFGNFGMLEYGLAVLGFLPVLRWKRSRWWLLGWLMLAPLPAAITKAGVHSTRGIFILPVVIFLAAFGAETLMRWGKRRAIGVVIATLLLLQAGDFMRAYVGEYRHISDHVFGGYMKRVSQDLYQMQRDYEGVIMTFGTESPYIFYAFYNRVDPAWLQREIRRYPPTDEGFVHVRKLGEVHFESVDFESAKTDKRYTQRLLGVSKADQVPNWLRIEKTWHNLASEAEVVSWEYAGI